MPRLPPIILNDLASLFFLLGTWGGLLGTSTSTIIRLELGNNQFYTNIVTAHALLIILFLVIPLLTLTSIILIYTLSKSCSFLPDYYFLLPFLTPFFVARIVLIFLLTLWYSYIFYVAINNTSLLIQQLISWANNQASPPPHT